MRNWNRLECCFLSVALLCAPGRVLASPDSTSTLIWRADADRAPPSELQLRVGLDLHSNLTVRAVPHFHRPDEDLAAQKLALVPELRARIRPDLELQWTTALAIQDRIGTRAELPHADASQQIRARYRIIDGERWQAWTAAALIASFQRDGSLRYELSATLVRRHPLLDVEAQLLHHQAAFGESASQFALAYAHLQIGHRYRSERLLLLPLLRASVEAAETGYGDQPPVGALSAQLLASYRLSSLPVRLLVSLGAWYRADLQDWTASLSVGFQTALFAADDGRGWRENSTSSGLEAPQGGPTK